MGPTTSSTRKTRNGKHSSGEFSAKEGPPQLRKITSGAAAGWPLFLGRTLQRKLAVGALDDPLEREADQVAERVTRSMDASAAPITGSPSRNPESLIRRKCACEGSSQPCEECRKRDAETPGVSSIHRQTNGASHASGESSVAAHAARPNEAPPIVHEALRSPGHPLPSSIRGQMESSFSRDFSGVRVHNDAVAAESAGAVDALAYTAGEDVVFASGQYTPESESGRKLLAHELAHVVQQDGASVIHRQPSGTKQETSPPQNAIDWHPGMFAKVVKEFLGYKASGVEAYKVGEILEVTSGTQGFGSHNEVQVVSAALPGHPRGTHLAWVGVENLVPIPPPARSPSGESGSSFSTDLTKMSITPQWARTLSDSELGIQETILSTTLYGQISPGTADYLSAQQNLQVLEDEQQNRAARPGALGLQPQFVPRPGGLPLDDGYALQELPALSLGVAAQIPEGQIVTLSDQALSGTPPKTEQPPAFLPGLGGGSWSGLRGADASLMKFGLVPGDYAIGLVAIPPASPNPFSQYPNLTALENPLEWAGHTAVYVRQGGQITIVRGYNPRMRYSEPSTIWEMLKDYKKIFGGKKGVTGDITEDFGMFRSTSVRTVEYPVTPDVAAEFAGSLPPLGTPGPGEPPMYSAPPSTYATTSSTQVGCEGTNCGLWATQKVEGPLGARVGVVGQEPIVDIPVPGQAAQGKIYGMMDPASSAPLVEMPGATGPGVRGGVSGGLRVLKWGGRVFMVAGGVKLGYDIWTAPEGEKGHVAFVEGSGLLGGIAAGAALGLLCGPGAPVCCVITGLIGGIAGGEAASTMAEVIWNFPQTARMANDVLQELEEQRLQQLVRKSGGTMPPAVQDAARRMGPAIFFAH